MVIKIMATVLGLLALFLAYLVLNWEGGVFRHHPIAFIVTWMLVPAAAYAARLVCSRTTNSVIWLIAFLIVVCDLSGVVLAHSQWIENQVGTRFAPGYSNWIETVPWDNEDEYHDVYKWKAKTLEGSALVATVDAVTFLLVWFLPWATYVPFRDDLRRQQDVPAEGSSLRNITYG
jgi:hypothetical protein